MGFPFCVKSLIAALVILAGHSLAAAPAGTAISYQGRLDDGVTPADGEFEFRFTLHDAVTGGAPVGAVLTNGPVAVAQGIFTTTLDFGVGVFEGSARWLEIGVRPAGSLEAFTGLTPRQPLLAVPYAHHALNGVPGDPGPAGPVGPEGPKGDAGAAGPAGPTGAKGDPGEPGAAGAVGPIGPAGPQGLKGDKGDPGEVGAIGPAGVTGPTGPQGPKGDPGEVGATGAQGLKGDTGAAGPIGPVGPAGPIGPQGVKGDPGTPGVAGATGAKGDVGAVGATGPAGPAGPQGLKGDKGDVGSAGAVGPAGPKGEVGAVGPAGAAGLTGAAGPKGDKGDAGAVGPTGPAGLQGLAGPAGPKGDVGAIGPAGPPGLTGANGPKGDPGVTGAAGPIGPQGLKGDKGDPGAVGPAGPAGPQGLAGPTGPKGDAGVVGPAGPSGSQGPAGPQGSIGLPGPAGATGSTGPQGPQGVAGPQGPPGSADAWSRTGNAGTSPSANFLGTTDNQPLEIKVNGKRGFRMAHADDGNSDGINILGGHSINRLFSIPGIIGATISGGGRSDKPNVVGSSFGSVGGGLGNLALFASTVSGGEDNHARGEFATIPGGAQNVADGAYSFSAGRGAGADHAGSFVWADSNPSAAFRSTGSNQFLVRASGGVAIGANDPQGHMLRVAGSLKTESDLIVGTSAGTVSITGGEFTPELKLTGGPAPGVLRVRNALEIWPTLGATIAPGYLDVRSGSGVATITLNGLNGTVTAVTLTPTSDRNAKENFEPVDPQEVLAKVAALPITRWNFKSDTQAEHVGPMAQDFREAFGLGADDKHIATVDADGVALAAIQGLHRKVEAENAALREKDAALEARLARLEKLLGSQDNGGGR